MSVPSDLYVQLQYYDNVEHFLIFAEYNDCNKNSLIRVDKVQYVKIRLMITLSLFFAYKELGQSSKLFCVHTCTKWMVPSAKVLYFDCKLRLLFDRYTVAQNFLR